jgi:hypothetical protein
VAIARAANADLDQLCELYVATGNSPTTPTMGEEGEPMFDHDDAQDDGDHEDSEYQ